MKTFKLADLAGQVLVLAGGLFYWYANKDDESLFWIYYSMGAWQLCSFFIHQFLQHSWVALNSRRKYCNAVIVVAIIQLVSLLLIQLDVPLIIYTMGALLFVAPVLAAWYFIIGVGEWRSIKRKELIHLK